MEQYTFEALPEGFRIATKEDFPLVTLTLAQSFADYGYPIPSVPLGHSTRLRFFYDAFGPIVTNAMENGVVLTNEDFSAVLVTVPLEKSCTVQQDPLARAMQGYTTEATIRNMYEIFDHIDTLEEKLSFREKTVYVELFAVQTPRQGQKLGSKLMRQLFAQCDRQGMDIMLFTNTQKNCDIYRHLGFDLVLQDEQPTLPLNTYFLLHRAQPEPEQETK